MNFGSIAPSAVLRAGYIQMDQSSGRKTSEEVPALIQVRDDSTSLKNFWKPCQQLMRLRGSQPNDVRGLHTKTSPRMAITFEASWLWYQESLV